MRALLLTALLLRVCAAELAPAALAAHHGGTVVAADDRAVEVSVAGDVVEAWVVDADGVPIEASADPITVTVQLETGPAPVGVAWDPVTLSYKGTAPAPVVAGPVEVSVVVEGEPRVGRVDTIVVVAAPSTVVVGGAPSVVVEGSHPHVVVERPRGPDVVVEAPRGPTVVVEGPRAPGVVVVPPSPPGIVVVPPSPPGIVVVPPSPPGIVVVPPSPPGVHVHVDDGHHDHGRHRGHEIGRGHGGHGHGH